MQLWRWVYSPQNPNGNSSAKSRLQGILPPLELSPPWHDLHHIHTLQRKAERKSWHSVFSMTIAWIKTALQLRGSSSVEFRLSSPPYIRFCRTFMISHCFQCLLLPPQTIVFLHVSDTDRSRVCLFVTYKCRYVLRNILILSWGQTRTEISVKTPWLASLCP